MSKALVFLARCYGLMFLDGWSGSVWYLQGVVDDLCDMSIPLAAVHTSRLLFRAFSTDASRHIVGL